MRTFLCGNTFAKKITLAGLRKEEGKRERDKEKEDTAGKVAERRKAEKRTKKEKADEGREKAEKARFSNRAKRKSENRGRRRGKFLSRVS